MPSLAISCRRGIGSWSVFERSEWSFRRRGGAWPGGERFLHEIPKHNVAVITGNYGSPSFRRRVVLGRGQKTLERIEKPLFGVLVHPDPVAQYNAAAKRWATIFARYD